VIVQETEKGLRLYRQTDHALLSGAFAAAWGNDAFREPPVRESTLVAASRHDDGWAEWELAPRVDDAGGPVDFMHIPVDEHTALYRRGIDLVEIEDPYAGLVVSLHGERLYTRPFVPGLQPRIDYLTGRDLEIAQSYVAYEHQRQAILAETAITVAGGPLVTGDLGAEAEECWRLLQVWDRLSLFACMEPLDGDGTWRLPPVAGRGGADVEIDARMAGDGKVVLSPYPFATDPAGFEIEAFDLDAKTWDDESSFRAAYRTAARRIVAFACRSA
jgi:hypothetical protein